MIKVEAPRYFSGEPERIFAIGDVHGCVAELEVLLRHLEERERLSQNDLIVFVGDYIDRGPDSFGVLRVVQELKARYPHTILLRGNHEVMLEEFLDQREPHFGRYLDAGGKTFLRECGVKDLRSVEEANDKVPDEVRAFIALLERYVVVGRYVFVHAGLNPLNPLDAQEDRDIYWIRQEFIHNIHRFQRTVVFGHTPTEIPLVRLPFKIGIDTGLVYGNRLTCVELPSMRFLSVRAGERSVGIEQID